MSDLSDPRKHSPVRRPKPMSLFSLEEMARWYDLETDPARYANIGQSIPERIAAAKAMEELAHILEKGDYKCR